MSGALAHLAGERQILIATAVPREANAVLLALGSGEAAALWKRFESDRFDLVMTGVGKANAAGAVARNLDVQRHAAVVNLGIGGSLPDTGVSLLDVVLATRSCFADEGLASPDGFIGCDAMGFPLCDAGTAVEASRPWLDAMRPLADHIGSIATVSTCSGTDTLARERQERTQALAEGMEGAAIGLVCERLGVPFIEARTISNTTGNRASQMWNLDGALRRLGTLAASL